MRRCRSSSRWNGGIIAFNYYGGDYRTAAGGRGRTAVTIRHLVIFIADYIITFYDIAAAACGSVIVYNKTFFFVVCTLVLLFRVNTVRG